MNVVITSACCLLLFSFTSLNPQHFFEKVFIQPLNIIKSIFGTGLPTQAKAQKSYIFALVGDSMTQFLGSGTDLDKDLKKYYPSSEFSILNYGYGATNILSVPDRLKIVTSRGSEALPAILDKKPDIIFLESFGNNPLSQFPLSEGLKKQEEALDNIIKIIKEKKPDTVLIFIATAAPVRDRYGEGVVNLSTEQRRKWADERIAYIKNHIKYAKDHKIPLINVYQKSLDKNGEGSIDYINSYDFIHPSPTGILFISQQIADFIYKKRVLPR